MKIKKFRTFLCAVLFSTFLSAVPCMASVDSPLAKPEDAATDKGSITIELEDTKDKASKKDVKFCITKVADVVDGEYILTDSYKDTNVDLNKIKTADELCKAAEKLMEKKIAGTTFATDEKGSVVIGDLPVGVYLLHVTDRAKYEIVTPFLISIPTYDGKEMVYDVLVLPKHTPVPKVPKTGDDSSLIEYGALALICLVVAGASYIIIKEGKRKEKMEI